MSSLKTFWEVTISGLPSACEPALTSWMFRQGCLGTAEKLQFRQPSLKYLPEIESSAFIDMSAYFPVVSREELEAKILKWLQDHAPQALVQWQVLENKDWLSEWKKHFKPFRLAGFLFAPQWEKKADIYINPGMAFGTGHHATTRFAIQQLRQLKARRQLINRVLDVGAGSGILSIVSEKLGAKYVLAIDNDPESWRECSKNFRLNKSRFCHVSKKQLDQVLKPFDVVVANIVDGVLMELKQDLWNRVEVGGYLVLSGILKDGLSVFEKDFTENLPGARIVKRVSDKEWACLTIRKAS